MKSKYIIKLIDSKYVLYKRSWIFWYTPMIFEDSFGLEYTVESESRESLLAVLTLFLSRGWMPHDDSIMQRVE
jgi:hypothetical protein